MRVVVRFAVILMALSSVAHASVEMEGLSNFGGGLGSDLEMRFLGVSSRYSSISRALTCAETLTASYAAESNKLWRRILNVAPYTPKLPPSARYTVGASDADEAQNRVNIEVRWPSLRKEESRDWNLQFENSPIDGEFVTMRDIGTGKVIELPDLNRIATKTTQFDVFVARDNQFILRMTVAPQDEESEPRTLYYNLTTGQLVSSL